jgi:hypothetical protein
VLSVALLCVRTRASRAGLAAAIDAAARVGILDVGLVITSDPAFVEVGRLTPAVQLLLAAYRGVAAVGRRGGRWGGWRAWHERLLKMKGPAERRSAVRRDRQGPRPRDGILEILAQRLTDWPGIGRSRTEKACQR